MNFSINICNSEASNQRVHEWKPCTIGEEEQFRGDTEQWTISREGPMTLLHWFVRRQESGQG
jgi:hypothetical protein